MSYIIKSEINGIQEFIFNIESKGAAKALKARSFAIDATCALIREIFKEVFPGTTEIFTGGGNVCLEISNESWDKNEFERKAKEIINHLAPYQMFASFSFNPFVKEDEAKFGDFIKDLNDKLSKEKLRFGIHDFKKFEPRNKFVKSQDDLAGLTKTYSASKSTTIINKAETEFIGKDYFQLLNKKLIFTNDKSNPIIPLPVWKNEIKIKLGDKFFDDLKKNNLEYKEPGEGDIISFEELAAFAKQRTATDNIGILKLDVDNLGKLFQQIKNRGENKFLSDRMKEFFREKVIGILNMNMPESNEKFLLNIYTVYAGGDDCFFIGAWDAIIEFAIELQKQFSIYEKSVIRKKLFQFSEPITISASIILVDSHFPVMRFAEIAEENLDEAKAKKQPEKKDASGKDMKNNISFMGHIFSWDEFHELIKVKNTMCEMIIKHGESKAFLQRIIHAFENSDTIYWHRCKPAKPFNPAILWRFLYSFRDIKMEDYFQKNFYNLFFSKPHGYYEKYVLNQFSIGKELSQIMPVAARWSELLTRNQTK